jgi:hypothetical protein
MRKHFWQAQFDATLQRNFLVSVEDAGLDQLDLEDWRDTFPTLPQEAARAFGRKYGLEQVGVWFRFIY